MKLSRAFIITALPTSSEFKSPKPGFDRLIEAWADLLVFLAGPYTLGIMMKLEYLRPL